MHDRALKWMWMLYAFSSFFGSLIANAVLMFIKISALFVPQYKLSSIDSFCDIMLMTKLWWGTYCILKVNVGNFCRIFKAAL